MTEEELVERCRRGERQAQQELYARTGDRIYRLLLRLTGDPDDAFDLSQETYLRVFRTIGQFEGKSSVATWVYRIAVNEGLQFLRRKKRRSQGLRERTAPIENIGEQATAAIRLDVEEALAELPEEDRILIVLRYFDGLDYAKLAEVLGKPPGTIASGLNRARRAMRDRLESKSAQDW